VRPIQFLRRHAVAGIAHVIQVVSITEWVDRGVVRAQAVPEFFAPWRQRNVAALEWPERRVAHRVSDLGMG
jgi:hypothetical protein